MAGCKEIKTLKPEEEEVGATLALNNAEALLRAASVMARRRQYGLANSLAILSVEEAIKSQALMFHAAVRGEPDDFLCKLFSQHKTKHKIWVGMQIMMTFSELFTKTILHYTEREERDGKQPGTYRNRAIKEIIDTMKSWGKGRPGPLTTAKTWYERANSQKNRGLYIDYQDGKWWDPADVDKITYIESKRHAQTIIEITKNFAEIDRAELRRIYAKHFKPAANS